MFGLKIFNLVLVIFCQLMVAFAAAKVIGTVDIRFKARTAGSLTNLSESKSNLFTGDFEQKLKSDPWTIVIGARAMSESNFAAHPERYSSYYAQRNSSEFQFRDVYLQYFSGALFARLGNQQIAWGEAFGFYYSDILNPKDLRELGLGDLADNRKSIPMVDLKLIGESSTLELVYIPKGDIHRLPDPGSDFFITPPDFSANVSQLRIGKDQTEYSPEYGMRIKSLIGKFDAAIFGFSGFDRQPIYSADLTTNPGSLTLNPSTSRYMTYGSTFSWDLSEVLLRGEFIFHAKRPLQIFESGNLSSRIVSNTVSVLGFDFISIEWAQIGLQLARDSLADSQPFDLRQRNMDLASLRIAKDIKPDWSLVLFASANIVDGSTLAEFQIKKSLSKRSEFEVAVQRFDGEPLSQFGLYKDASRVLASLKLMDSQ